MSFETDVFISYAHIDNLPLKEGEKGWVAKFHRALEVRLSQLLGEKPRIWRDQKLQGNDFFGEEIVDQFPKLIWFNPTGEGDAFLNRNFLKMLRYLKSKSIAVLTK